MQSATFSTSEAARAAGVSPGTVRNLLGGRFALPYAGLWSQSAMPAKGEPRRLSESDVRQIAFVRSRSAAGLSHAQIAEELRAGALEGFTWSLPAEAEPEPQQPAQDAALIVWQTTAGILQRELAEARQTTDALFERVVNAEAARAAAEAVAEQLRSQVADLRRPWWKRFRR
jgi:DNA-binding transcriptional MerR regulator